MNKLKEKIENAKNEAKAANLSLEEIKSRAEDLSEEYKRLEENILYFSAIKYILDC